METIQELKQKSIDYVNQKSDDIINGMIRRNELTTKESTCDCSHWDREYHRMFPKIADELRKRGLSVCSKVNYGVTDWYITL